MKLSVNLHSSDSLRIAERLKEDLSTRVTLEASVRETRANRTRALRVALATTEIALAQDGDEGGLRASLEAVRTTDAEVRAQEQLASYAEARIKSYRETLEALREDLRSALLGE